MWSTHINNLNFLRKISKTLGGGLMFSTEISTGGRTDIFITNKAKRSNFIKKISHNSAHY